MGIYTGIVQGITPNTSNDNWALDTAATVFGYVTSVHWGGEVTTSTAMQTRVTRTTATGNAATAGNVNKANQRAATNLVTFVSSWTTQPALAAGALIGESWNAHGGIFYWHSGNADEEFLLVGNLGATAGISCRNVTGTGASSYGCAWREA